MQNKKTTYLEADSIMHLVFRNSSSNFLIKSLGSEIIPSFISWKSFQLDLKNESSKNRSLEVIGISAIMT